MASLETVSIHGTTDLEEVHFKLTDTMKEDVRSLWDSRLFSDVTVRVNGVEFRTHRVVLYSNSPMFRNMFTCETADKYEDVIELKRTGTVYIDEKSFEILLKYMYTSEMKLNSQTVLGVLRTADYLGMEEPIRSCFSFLRKVINANNCLALFKIAYYYNNNDLLLQSIPIIWENFAALRSGLVEFESGEFNTVLNTVAPKYKRNEETACSAVLSWVKHEQASRLHHLTEMMLLVRLTDVPSSFLCDTLREERLVRSDDACFSIFMDAIGPRVTEPKTDEEEGADESLARSEAVITFSITNSLEEMEYKATEFSPKVMVRGVPWRLKIKKTRTNRIRMGLQCCYEHDSKWSFDVSLQCRVIAYEKGVANQEHDLCFRFDPYNKTGGNCDVVDLNAPYTSYVAPENTMTFQVYFKVDPLRLR